MAHAVMVEGATLAQRHPDHRLLGGGGRLGDRLGHLAGLAVAEAGPALAVADDDEGREAEALAALHRLGDAVDVDQFLDQLLAAVVVAAAAAAALVAPAAIAAAAIVASAATAAAAARAAVAPAFGTGLDRRLRRSGVVGRSGLEGGFDSRGLDRGRLGLGGSLGCLLLLGLG